MVLNTCLTQHLNKLILSRVFSILRHSIRDILFHGINVSADQVAWWNRFPWLTLVLFQPTKHLDDVGCRITDNTHFCIWITAVWYKWDVVVVEERLQVCRIIV
uniref:Uncharacterized protein n=1 Tax=Cacopsylla melanoneura TaxID=428564 RepID=A0A8D8LUX4_9HEMI